MNNLRKKLVKNPYLTCLITAIITLTFYFVIQFTVEMNLWIYTIREIVVALIILFIIKVVAGSKTIEFSNKGFSYVFKKSWWALVIPFIQSVFLIGLSLLKGTQISFSTLIIGLLVPAVFAISVGIFEEGLFRGLILNALLDKLGNTKRGIAIAVFISAFLFGLLHITSALFSGQFIDSTSLITGILKIAQTGMFGYLLAVLYIRSRSFWGIVIVHALNDYLPFAATTIVGQNINTSYVSTGILGLTSIVSYLFLILLYVPLVIIALKQLKLIQPPINGFFVNSPWIARNIDR